MHVFFCSVGEEGREDISCLGILLGCVMVSRHIWAPVEKEWGLSLTLMKQGFTGPSQPCLPCPPDLCPHLFQVMFEEREHPPRCLQGPRCLPLLLVITTM